MLASVRDTGSVSWYSPEKTPGPGVSSVGRFWTMNSNRHTQRASPVFILSYVNFDRFRPKKVSIAGLR